MKTIFDQINIEKFKCATGSCDHVAHTSNGYMWFLVVALIFIGAKYCHASNKEN